MIVYNHITVEKHFHLYWVTIPLHENELKRVEVVKMGQGQNQSQGFSGGLSLWWNTVWSKGGGQHIHFETNRGKNTLKYSVCCPHVPTS